jgi:hypothetical protein
MKETYIHLTFALILTYSMYYVKYKIYFLSKSRFLWHPFSVTDAEDFFAETFLVWIRISFAFLMLGNDSWFLLNI